MQQALGGADKIEKIHDFEQLVRAETWDRMGRPIGQVRKRTRWIKPKHLRLASGAGRHVRALPRWMAPAGRSCPENTWRISPAANWSSRKTVVRVSARKIVNGQLDITLDPVSWLPVKQTSISLADPAHPEPSETQIKEWMTVHGIKFPRRVWILHNGIRLADIATEEIKVNGGLRPADLAMKPADLDPVLSGR